MKIFWTLLFAAAQVRIAFYVVNHKTDWTLGLAVAIWVICLIWFLIQGWRKGQK